MTLTKVVLPEYCSPTSVSSISSFQKSERNQSSRREMRASMMAAGREDGQASGQAAGATTSTQVGLGSDPPNGSSGPRRDAGGHGLAAAAAEARKPNGSYDSPYPHARPRAAVCAHGKSGGPPPPTPRPGAPAAHSATWWGLRAAPRTCEPPLGSFPTTLLGSFILVHSSFILSTIVY